MAGIPIFGDQPDNVAKAVSKKKRYLCFTFAFAFFFFFSDEVGGGKKLSLIFLGPLSPSPVSKKKQKKVAGGWGVMLPLRRLSAERLAAAVRKVVGGGSDGGGGEGSSSSSAPAPYSPSVFRLAALRVSARMRSRRRHPVSDAIDAVEGVLATDGDMYLKTGDHLVPLWRYAMLDVAAVYLVVGLCVRAVFRALFGGGRRGRRGAAASSPSSAAAPTSHSDDESAPLKPPITPNASPARERRPDTAFGGGGGGGRLKPPAAFGTSPPQQQPVSSSFGEGLRARGAAAGAAES